MARTRPPIQDPGAGSDMAAEHPIEPPILAGSGQAPELKELIAAFPSRQSDQFGQDEGVVGVSLWQWSLIPGERQTAMTAGSKCP